MRHSRLRRPVGVFAIVGFLSVLSTMAGALPVAAAGYSAISGTFSVFPVASSSAPVQLLAGVNSDVWFVTAQSRLGHVSAAGQISLLPVTIPHGNAPATLIAADADGVWSFGDTTGANQSCTISLIRPGGHVMQRTLNYPVGPLCYAGAVDRSGNLWVSVQGKKAGQTIVSRMTEVSPSGVVTQFTTDRAGARPTAVALGSDGAIWALEFNTHEYGRYTETPPATSHSIRGSVKPPYHGTPYWGLYPHQLFGRSDGTFWLVQGGCCNAVALSSPDRWAVRYLLPFQTTVGWMSPDGSMWTVNLDRDFQTERLIRTAVDGTLDRSAALPASAGTTSSIGTLAAASDGSIWTVTTTTGGATNIVKFLPH